MSGSRGGGRRPRNRPGAGLVALAAAVAVTTAACAASGGMALDRISTESERSLSAGDYGAALDLHGDLASKEPGSEKVLAAYAATVEKIKSAADETRAQGRHGEAEGIYRALIDRWAGFSSFESKLSFKRADAEAGLRRCRVALWERQFGEELRAGRHAQALGAYQAALRAYPKDTALKAAVVKGFGEIAVLADKALAGKDYAAAGRINRLLLRNIASYEAAAGAADRKRLNQAGLTESVRRCATGLRNSGLADYRKGDLAKAIATWEEILAFDPENAEIKKAVETAKAQLGRIKSGAPGGGGRRGAIRSGSGRGPR